MSKELDYIADLERENRTIKSLLYCTVKSCNNCGKVNCENFQRQRIDCCGLWVSYKDYIAELEKENLVLHRMNRKRLNLQKERVQLKEKIEVLECDNYNANCNLNLITDQLTKAKKIIKEFARLEYADYTDGDYSNELSQVLEQAEQFIKEIEK